MTKEKTRMLGLAIVLVVFTFVFYVVDAYLYAKILGPASWEKNWDIQSYWWVVMPILTGLISVGVGLGAWLGDYRTGREDVYGTLLLVATPFILVWSGLMDIFSAGMIDWFFHQNFAYNWNIWLTKDWWWMRDPFGLGFSWSLPAWIGAFVKAEVLTVHYVIAGAIIGTFVLAGLWGLYWKHA